MNIQSELELYGEKYLIKVSRENLDKVDIPPDYREAIIKIGFPYTMWNLRFSMEFSPISIDEFVLDDIRQSRNLLTIGCKSSFGTLGFLTPMEDIGLHKGASLLDINARLDIIGRERHWDVFGEVKHSSRICVDLDDNQKIVYINPSGKDIYYCNSNLKNLLRSILAYRKFATGEVVNFDEEIETFKKELIDIDPQCLDNEECIWSNVIWAQVYDHECYEY